MNIIRPNSGNINAASAKVKQAKTANATSPKLESEDLSPPASRGFRSIPDLFVMEGLIKKALNALKKGVYWDRGSIINIEA